jgi:hypothetical protein
MAAASFSSVLSNPAWTAAATLLAVIAIATTIVLYRRGKARKVLACAASSTSLVSVRSEAQGKIKVLYEDDPVTGVHLVTFSLSNSGNVPIPADDFERPVVLELGANAVPLPGTIEVKEAKPAELQPNVSAEGATLIVEPLLLNPGDSFSIAALVRDFAGPLAVDGRVVGVSKIGLGEPDGYKGGRLLRTTRWALEGGAAVLVAGVAGSTLGVALWGLLGDHKEHTRIVLESGTTFCGKVLRVDASRLVVQLKDGGRVRILRTANVRSIRNNAC